MSADLCRCVLPFNGMADDWDTSECPVHGEPDRPPDQQLADAIECVQSEYIDTQPGHDRSLEQVVTAARRATYLQREINKMRRVMQDAGTWDQFCKDYAAYTVGDRIDN